MNKNSSVKRICVTAACIALCYVLPIAFHALGLGRMFSPMHIPVLLCGLVCGGGCGIICGIAGPVLSSVLSGMPGPAGLITMVPELAAYGLTAGLLMKLIRTRNLYADLYIALTSAMLVGRVVGGVASALFYIGKGESFTIALWAGSYFAGTLPGIVCHLVIIPLLVLTLMKARVIPERYPAA